MMNKPELYAVDGGRTQFYTKPTIEQIMSYFGATWEQAHAMHKDISITGIPGAPIKIQGGAVNTRIYIALNKPIEIGRYNTDGEFNKIIAIPPKCAFVIPTSIQRLALSIRGDQGPTAYIAQKDSDLLFSNIIIQAGVFDVMTDFVRALTNSLHQYTHVKHDGVLQASKLVMMVSKDDRIAEFEALKLIKVQVASLLKEYKNLSKLLRADERNEQKYFHALGRFHHYGCEHSLQDSLSNGLVALCHLSRVDEAIRQKLTNALLDFYYSNACRVYTDEPHKLAYLKASLDAFVMLNAHLLKMEKAR